MKTPARPVASARRLLCVLPQLPDRTTGGGIVLHEILVHLLTLGRVAAIVPVPAHLTAAFRDIRADVSLQDIEWHVLEDHRPPGWRGRVSGVLDAAPADTARFASRANHAIFSDARRRFDPTVELVVSTWGLAAYPGYELPGNACLYMVNVDPVIIRHDGPSLLRRAMARLDRMKVDRLCRRALRSAKRVGAISEADIGELGRMGGRTDVAHVPPLMRPRPLDRSDIVPGTVLVTTNFTYSQNRASLAWFLQECWPRVAQTATLTVTGRDADGQLERLCRLYPRVVYRGCLSVEELDDAFARTAVAVNPTILGSGFQVKLLDAIARGVPVVSTDFSNRIGSVIPSSDDPRVLATLIDDRLTPGEQTHFDYGLFYAAAVEAWDRFLLG